MGQAGRLYLESRYDWCDNARIIEALYEKALDLR